MIRRQDRTIIKFCQIVIKKSNILGSVSGATFVPRLLEGQIWIEGDPLTSSVSVDCQLLCCLTKSLIDDFHDGVEGDVGVNENLKIARITFHVSESKKTKFQHYVSERISTTQPQF